MNYRSCMRCLAFGIFVLVGLVACGGGGEDGGEAESEVVSKPLANGIWQGYVDESGVRALQISVLSSNDRIVAISELVGVVYDGNYTVNGTTISGTFNAYRVNVGLYATATVSGRVNYNESGASISGTVIAKYVNSEKTITATFSGSVTEQESISITFNTSDEISGKFSLSFNKIYNSKSSLSLVSGSWNNTNGANSLTITVQNNGTYWGQGSDGCVLSGAIEVLDPTHNLYSMSTSISSCELLNGDYTGLSSLVDYESKNDKLQFVISNSKDVILYHFLRQ